MNKDKKKKFFKIENFRDYIKTFLITLFIVAIFGFANIFYMIHRVFDVPTVEKQRIDTAFESYLVDIIIDRNLEYAKTYPKNYAVNMRLGILYSYKKDYENAEKEFKKSIEKAATYDYMPRYQLAKLYARTNRLKEAQEIMDSIGEKPNKRLISYKGDIYKILGQEYYKQGYYALSVIKYEKAINYYEAIKSRYLPSLQAGYINACEALADNYVEFGKIDDAVNYLEKAYKMKPDNVILNYKLGLLYFDNNPEKSYEYLSFVNKKDPQMVNYDLFYELINILADRAYDDGKYTQSELYRKKAEQYQKFVKNNMLYDTDLFVDIMKLDVFINEETQNYVVNFLFKLQNNSDLDISNLSISVVLKDGDKVVQTYEQKIFDEDRVFRKEDITPPIVITVSEKVKNINIEEEKKCSRDLTIELYGYKYPKYKVLLLRREFPNQHFCP